MLKLGCVVLSLWLIVNLAASCVVLADTLTGHGHTPALYALLSPDEVGQLDPETLSTLDSIAAFANGMNLSFSLLALAVVWLGLRRRARWAFWALLAGLLGALLAGVAGDFLVGWVAPQVNLITAVWLAAGFVCAGLGLFRHPGSSGPARESAGGRRISG